MKYRNAMRYLHDFTQRTANNLIIYKHHPTAANPSRQQNMLVINHTFRPDLQKLPIAHTCFPNRPHLAPILPELPQPPGSFAFYYIASKIASPTNTQDWVDIYDLANTPTCRSVNITVVKSIAISHEQKHLNWHDRHGPTYELVDYVRNIRKLERHEGLNAKPIDPPTVRIFSPKSKGGDRP